MAQASITSSDSFAGRAQRSEANRVVLWLVVLSGMLALTIVRRWVGGRVMSDNRMFFPYAGALALGVAGQVALLRVVGDANRAGRLLPEWVWRAGAVFDLAVASSLLVVAAFLSPRGPEPALTAPPLLLLPLVVLTSVLRLRPHFTLYAGLAGAAIHLLLAVRAIVVTHAPPDTYPVHFAYAFLLVLTAFAGMVVARAVRGQVREAADEAAAHERSQRQVMGMRRDLAVAREIQLGLLPTRTPQVPGFEIAGMNRPADQTGGDYYDWQPLPDGRLAVVLADVSGHGIGPALVMAVCRAYARATAHTTPDPAAMVARLNDLLDGDLPSDRFITFALAVIDASGAAQLVSAGHGPTLLYRASTGDVTEFGGDGMPLGVLAGETYGPAASFTLDRGDVLVLLTDGFFEWPRPSDGQPFGIARLHDALRAGAGGDAAGILRSIDDAVCRFCDGSAQPDDMTAIVVKRTAPAANPLAGTGAAPVAGQDEAVSVECAPVRVGG
jgi:serine phosphatase RsbU (regulator of sigma subunit)